MGPAEARLLADWNLETIAAFGAELRDAGDPRGELIAIDLVLETGPSPAVRRALGEEKKALHIAWLGEVSEHMRSRFGFVEELREEPEDELAIFDRVAPFLRSFKLAGEYGHARELVARIAAAPRPWLVSLEIGSFTDTRETTIDNELGARLIAATPNLVRLALDGHFVCDELPHPGVTDLVVQGFDAVGALRGKGAMPNAKRLDLMLHPDQFIRREPPPPALREGWVPRAGFPALEILDLSRNEPASRTREPNCYAGETAFFDVLPRIAILPYVRELRVPSVRGPLQREHLASALAQMPALQRLEIARTYDEPLPPPKHPTAVVVVAERAVWPPANQLRDYDALLFHIGDAWVRAELAQAYEICEARYATMSPPQQRAWAELWQLVGALGTSDPARIVTFPTAYLRCAAALADAGQYEWEELATALEEHAAESIAVRRLDGYEDRPEEPAEPRIAASGERVDELERELQGSWDLERLAVYADELLQLGDKRGELIAIDLRIAREGEGRDHELDFRRDDLHEQIFGDTYELRSKLGFTSIDVGWSTSGEDPLATLLVGDTSRYLREIEIAGVLETVERDLGYVLAEPRPWLHAIRVETMGRGDDAHLADWTRVHEDWPNLRILELGFDEPASVFAGFVHPHVTELRITDLPALAQLGGPWPAVTTLDIAFGNGGDPTHLLMGARFPALHTLDLARNEPQVGRLDRDHRFQGPDNLFDILARLDAPLLAALRHVRVPSLRDDAAVRALGAALDRMPALETLEVVRRYPHGPAIALQHPRARIAIPETSPWPPLDRIPENASLAVDTIHIPLRKAAGAMEKTFARMVDPGRDAWAGLWRALEGPAARITVKAADVYAAMAELEERDAYAHEWAAQLVAALHSPALADETITIYRR